MSLEKAIYYGKEHRKPLWRSARFDYSCRNHGACGYCEANRLFWRHKIEMAAYLQEMEELDGSS
jgi:hypothetical protein